MNKLDELRKLAKEATPMPELLSRSYKDMKFMREVRNNIDALLDVAEGLECFLSSNKDIYERFTMHEESDRWIESLKKLSHP